MIEIIINRSYKLDGFKPSEVIALTFAEAKFNNLVTRGGTFSNKIKLGKTVNNRQVLGFPEDNRETSSRPYTRFECEIKIGQNPVFYGVAILELTQDFYELRVFSGLTDFFKLLNDKTLPELDLSDLNHNWTAANVRSATNSSTDYCYPAINYGRWTGIKASRANTDFFPAVYFKRLLESSATELGWTLNNYSETQSIPFSKESIESERGCLFEISINGSWTGGITPTGILPIYTNTAINIDAFNTIVSDPTDHVYNYSGTADLDYSYKLREGGVYDFEATIYYDVNYPPTFGAYFCIILVDNSGAYQKILAVSDAITDFVGTGTVVIKAFGVRYEANRNVTIGIAGNTATFTTGTKLKCTSGKEPIVSGNIINIADTLPKIKCKDLFLFEAVRQNALIVADPITKTLEFVPFDTIADRWGAARDWTDKVDLTIKPKYEYRLTDYAQVNELRWKDGTDEDVAYKANNELGNSSFDIDDRGLDDTKVEYTAPFAASVRRSSFTDNTHAYIPRYSDSSIAYDAPDINPVVRAMPLVSSTDNLVQITSASAVTDQMQGFPETWAEIKADNYTSFEAMLNRLKLVTVQVNLTAEDIASLDFTYPVKMLGNYWFLQEVKQWKANKAGTTTVKAIRL